MLAAARAGLTPQPAPPAPRCSQSGMRPTLHLGQRLQSGRQLASDYGLLWIAVEACEGFISRLIPSPCFLRSALSCSQTVSAGAPAPHAPRSPNRTLSHALRALGARGQGRSQPGRTVRALRAPGGSGDVAWQGQGAWAVPAGWRGPGGGGTACEESLFMRRTLGICYSGTAAAPGCSGSPQ